MVRATALVTVAALALHELRYLIGYGGGAHEALASQGHDYLPVASAVVGVLLVVALAQLAARVLRRSGESDGPDLRVAWALASAALLLIFVSQESLEGILSSGHPAGMAAVTAHGGLVAVPLAIAFGGFVALGLKGASKLVAAAAARSTTTLPRPRGPRRLRLDPLPPAGGVLALKLAGRAPPSLR